MPLNSQNGENDKQRTFQIVEFSFGLLVGFMLLSLAMEFIGWLFVKTFLIWVVFYGGLAFLSGLFLALGFTAVLWYLDRDR